jgi:hypothetical protein
MYFEELQKAGKDCGMVFKLVFDKSCNGILSEDQIRRLPNNIQNLYLTGHEHSGPGTLNFTELLSPLSAGESFTGRLAKSLFGRFPAYIVDGEVQPNALASVNRPIRWTPLLFFLPLVSWLAWFVWKKKTDTSSRSAAATRARSTGTIASSS